MSSDNTVACGTCHMPQAGGSDPRSFQVDSRAAGPDGVLGTPDDVRGSIGVVRCSLNGSLVDDGVHFPNRQVSGRRSMPFFGSQWSPELFWDGRARGPFVDPDTSTVLIPVGGALEIQALGPMVSAVEMACDGRTYAEVAAKITSSKPMRLAASVTPDIQAALAANPTYPALFNAAFGTPIVTAARIAMAIATYERTLVPNQTPWDAYVAGNANALTPNQIMGLNAFSMPTTMMGGMGGMMMGGNCSTCHSPPFFTDHSFRAIGVQNPLLDPGRQTVTGNFADRGRFKVAPLRNIGLRAPYFHNGSASDLNQVMVFYNNGGSYTDNQDPLIPPINLSTAMQNSIVDFLSNGLLDPRVAAGVPPFDRPILHSEVSPSNPLAYGPSSSGAGGFQPVMIAFAPPNLGNPAYTIGVGHGLGGSVAVLAIASQSASPGLLLSGIPLNVAYPPSPTLVVAPLGGPMGMAGKGLTSLTVSIPDVSALIGLHLYAQWFVLDPAATGGYAATSGADLTFFGP